MLILYLYLILFLVFGINLLYLNVPKIYYVLWKGIQIFNESYVHTHVNIMLFNIYNELMNYLY